jgi:hypothetical protein
MSTTTLHTLPRNVNRSPVAGWICFAGAMVGIAQAMLLLLVPAVVGTDRFSYPFSPTGFRIAQLSFALQHLALVVGVLALARSEWSRRSRLARIGFGIGVVGLLALTAMEVLALTAANSATTSAEAQLVKNLYGAPSMIIGFGLLIGGIGFARSSGLTGWRRWLPLALGIFVFVPLLPAVFAPFAFGRIAIAGWMMLFAALGWMLARPVPDGRV